MPATIVTNETLKAIPNSADEVYLNDVENSNVDKKTTIDGIGKSVIQAIIIPASDEDTPLAVGTSKFTFRMPYAFKITGVRASVKTAPTGSGITIDINESGLSILSTKITIDATQKTSVTAAVPPVISDPALADDSEITIDIDGVGSTIAGTGLKVTILGTRA